MSTNVKLVIGFGIIIIVNLFWMFFISKRIDDLERYEQINSRTFELLTDTMNDILDLYRLDADKSGALVDALNSVAENQAALRDICENNITPENKAKSPE